MDEYHKIIHIDMDAFFASVEQFDTPEYKGKPLVVGGRGPRSVVAAASYEARKYKIHSAMPMTQARRLCPTLIIIPPRFERYALVSRQIMDIFHEYTDLVEPLSLDEAFLDVTVNKPGMSSATLIAEEIRRKIWEKTGLTASAGVSINKFVAKVASDINKPNGITVILPHEVGDFLKKLPIQKFYGIGAVTAEKMKSLGIHHGADLLQFDLPALIHHFGKVGAWYYDIVRGIDHRPVQTTYERKSFGTETTYSEDLYGEEAVRVALEKVCEELWRRLEKKPAAGKTVTLKIRYADFTTKTISKSYAAPIENLESFLETAQQLLQKEFPLKMGVRLLGLTFSNLQAESSVTLPIPFPSDKDNTENNQ
ncbi:MAG TPA: DNA polymerase IV [Candidatus Marinimicrobia bacterium]|nr:DNA polymerase IV [Candidatus Neomarinimicrobiota bacterium]